MGRPRSQNDYVIYDNYIEIVCKHCNFLIDKDDLEKVKLFNWHSKFSKCKNSYYAYSHYKGDVKLLLHRYLLNITDSKVKVDHINGNTLDNRKENLRVVTNLQNVVNSKKRKNCVSKYKGVTLRPSGRWGSYIHVNKKPICLGTYDLEEDAAKAYDKKAVELWGEYAKLNFK